MRTKSGILYRTSVNNVSMVNGVLTTITGDFNGGQVLVTAVLSAAIPGVGGWATLGLNIDGVAFGQQAGNYQSGGNLGLTFTGIVRILPGKHRVGVLFQSSLNPCPITGLDLSVVEL
jgi:hypothetical protein